MKFLLLRFVLLAWAFGIFAQTGNWQVAGSEVLAPISNEINSINEVRIFPNPVTDKRVNIESGNQAIQEIRITNIAGTVIYAKRFQSPVTKHQVVFENVPTGVYLLRIVTENNIARTSKLMIRNQ